jgi:hypothetical protein
MLTSSTRPKKCAVLAFAPTKCTPSAEPVLLVDDSEQPLGGSENNHDDRAISRAAARAVVANRYGRAARPASANARDVKRACRRTNPVHPRRRWACPLQIQVERAVAVEAELPAAADHTVGLRRIGERIALERSLFPETASPQAAGHDAENESTGSLVERAIYETVGNEPMSLDHVDRRIMATAVERAGGNLTAAARMIGLTRRQLAYRLQASRATPRLA